MTARIGVDVGTAGGRPCSPRPVVDGKTADIAFDNLAGCGQPRADAGNKEQRDCCDSTKPRPHGRNVPLNKQFMVLVDILLLGRSLLLLFVAKQEEPWLFLSRGRSRLRFVAAEKAEHVLQHLHHRVG